jgi:hypothetical protein
LNAVAVGESEVAYLGALNLTSVLVKGVGSALEKNSGAETKGVKAHFHLGRHTWQ